MKQKPKKFKRNIKDTVFTKLFKIPKYVLTLYKCLEKKDKNVVESDIKVITLSSVIANTIYNDLGLLVKMR